MKVVIAYNLRESVVDGSHFLANESNVYQEIKYVKGALINTGYDVVCIPVKEGPYLAIKEIKRINPDIVFNLVEGISDDASGEYQFAALLEASRLPFTGNTALALGICMDKVYTKYILTGAGLPTPQFEVVNSPSEVDWSSFPAIVKPRRQDASIGINMQSVVNNNEELQLALTKFFDELNEQALVVSFIDGREISVSLLGNENPKILALSEIKFLRWKSDLPRIVTYRAKWETESMEYKRTKPVCPAIIKEDEKKKMEDIAIKSFKVLGLRGYARIDMRLNKEGKPFIIDVNPNPDISYEAGFARAARAAGLSYTDLITQIISLGMEEKVLVLTPIGGGKYEDKRVIAV
ncbi:MAG: ATP-grasp domain-containing protein [bacterium]|nr:ATP-grasp domain-containing protein [bacterium]